MRTSSESRGARGLSPSYGIRHRSYDGRARLRGASRLFIVPTMYIPTAIITTPIKATQHKSAKQARGIASANKTSRCMSCPSPPRENNDRTWSDVPQPEVNFLSRPNFNATPTWTRQHAGLTLRHDLEAPRHGRRPASSFRAAHGSRPSIWLSKWRPRMAERAAHQNPKIFQVSTRAVVRLLSSAMRRTLVCQVLRAKCCRCSPPRSSRSKQRLLTALEKQLMAWHKSNPVSQRFATFLASVPLSLPL